MRLPTIVGLHEIVKVIGSRIPYKEISEVMRDRSFNRKRNVPMKWYLKTTTLGRWEATSVNVQEAQYK